MHLQSLIKHVRSKHLYLAASVNKLSHILLLWGNPEKTLVRIHVKLMCILKNLVNSTEVFFL